MKDPSSGEPPFELTEEILGQVAEICEALGRFAADLPTERSVLLRRANRIRTVHASLAVEGNTLSLDQVESVAEASGEAADPLKTGARSRAQSRAQSDRVIAALKSGTLSVSQLVMALGLRSKTGALKRTINDLLAARLIEYTIPEKPMNRLQKYRLTSKGRRRLAHRESAF